MDRAWNTALERWPGLRLVAEGERAPILESWAAAGTEAVERCRVKVDDAFLAVLEAFLAKTAEVSAHRWSERALVIACGLGQPDALAAFDALFLAPALRTLSRPLLGALEPDELAQLVRERLLVGERGRERLGSWAGTRPLGAWLRAVATRIALDQRSPESLASLESEEASEVIERLPGNDDPELVALKKAQRSLLAEALRDAAKRLPRRERVVLRLHLFNQLSTDQLGRMFHTHPATVRRWIQGARSTLLDSMRAWLEERHQLSHSQIDSVLHGVDSRIDLSLSALHSHSRA